MDTRQELLSNPNFEAYRDATDRGLGSGLDSISSHMQIYEFTKC